MRKWLENNKKRAYLLIFSVLVCFLGVILFDFSTLLIENETKRGYRELTRSAHQSVLVIDNQMEQYFVFLEKEALRLREESFSLYSRRRALKNVRELPGTNFDCMGIADPDGLAVLSSGERVQVGDTSYFQKAIAGENYVTEGVREGKYTAIAAVPILGSGGRIRGVLFGEINLERMQLFAQIQEVAGSNYLYLMNEKGEFLLKSGADRKKQNYREQLEGASFTAGHQEISRVDQIEEYMQQRKNLLFSVDFEDRGEIIVMHPLSDSNWYLFEGTDRLVIDQEIHYYQRDMMLLTVKILTMFGILSGFYLYYTRKGQKKIEKLYAQLCLNEEAYRVTAEHSDQCIFIYDVTADQLRFMNEKYREFEIPKQEMTRAEILALAEERNYITYQRVLMLFDSVNERVPEAEKELFVRVNGQNRFLRVLLVNLSDEKGKVVRSFGMLEDITKQKENAMLVRREQEFRKSLLADCVGYLEVNLTEDTVLENSFSSGKRKDEEGGFSELIQFYRENKVVPEHREEVSRRMCREELLACLQNGNGDLTMEYQTMESDGNRYWTACDIHMKLSEATGDAIAYLVYRNIDAKKKERMKLEREATLDALTGAMKRKPAEERINRILSQMPENGRCHVFLMIDVDNFKTLNDTLGHQLGDQALMELAAAARTNCRRDDIVCRLGGDEFVIFLNGLTRENVEKKVGSFLQVLQGEYEKDGVSVHVSVSIGVALAPEHGESFKELYAAADKALYRAKVGGKGSYCIAE